MPDPLFVSFPIKLVKVLPVNVERLVPRTMSSTLDLVHEPRPCHANVNDNVNLAARVRLLPQRWNKLPHHLVVDSDGVGVHQNAHRRDVDGISRVWVLGP